MPAQPERARAITDDADDTSSGSRAFRAALAAVRAFGEMDPDDQRRFLADLIAEARADGWPPERKPPAG